jgi:hypothetical protein
MGIAGFYPSNGSGAMTAGAGASSPREGNIQGDFIESQSQIASILFTWLLHSGIPSSPLPSNTDLAGLDSWHQKTLSRNRSIVITGSVRAIGESLTNEMRSSGSKRTLQASVVTPTMSQPLVL